MCLSAAQTQNESWKHIPRHQKVNPEGFAVCLWNTSRPNVQRGLQDTSWSCKQQTVWFLLLGTHASISWLSEPSSSRHLIWNLKWLNAETSLHKKRTVLDNLGEKQSWDVLHQAETTSDPSPYSQALPSFPPAQQSWLRSSLIPSSTHAPVWFLSMKTEAGPPSQKTFQKYLLWQSSVAVGLLETLTSGTSCYLAPMHLSYLSTVEKSFFSPSGFILTLLAIHFTIKNTHTLTSPGNLPLF